MSDDPSSSSADTAFPRHVDSLELLRRYQGGDEFALEQLLQTYRSRLLRIVGIRMGVSLRQLEEADDVVQETFIVAARKLRDFEPVDATSILRWMVQVAQRQISDRRRHFGASKRRPPGGVPPQRLHSSPNGSSSGVDVPGEAPSPSDIARHKEAQEELDAAVRRITPEAYRQVILERDYLGSEWEDVRQRLDRSSIAAVQELHRRAHIKLRRMLRPDAD
jgi:RNA polymerase sigma factor (sigma-70 family)